MSNVFLFCFDNLLCSKRKRAATEKIQRCRTKDTLTKKYFKGFKESLCSSFLELSGQHYVELAASLIPLNPGLFSSICSKKDISCRCQTKRKTKRCVL
jgi:hypothetical protein